MGMRDKKKERLEKLVNRVMEITSDYCKKAIHKDKVEEAIRRLEMGDALRKTLQEYLPGRIVTRLLNNPEGFKVAGESRRATIMFADMSGFTGISEKLDTERVVSIVNGYFTTMLNIITRYGGTVDEFLGDALMVLFGSPVAHEDDPERAVRAALEMQEAMDNFSKGFMPEGIPPLQMTIGINAGNIICCDVGSSLRKEYTVVGNTVNLASRIQGKAQRGEILIGEPVYKAVGNKIICQKLNSFTPKGAEKPINVYKLIGVKEAIPERESWMKSGRTIGKDRELAIFQKCIEKVMRSKGQVVSLVGEAGIGKSRIISEIENYLSGKDVLYLKGTCLSYGKTISFLPFVEVLKSYFGIMNIDTPRAIVQKIRDRMVNLNPSWTHEVLHIVSIIVTQLEQNGDVLDVEERRQKIFSAVKDLFKTQAQRIPIVLIIEDIHWMDTASLDLLKYLTTGLKNVPLMICCTYTPEFKLKIADKSYHKNIAIGKLSSEQSIALIKSLLGASEGSHLPEFSKDIAELIISKSGGNPFYIEEIVKSLVQSGKIKNVKGKWKLSKQRLKFDIPDSIQETIMARIDRLEDNAKRTLQVASVIGTKFTFEVLKSISSPVIDLPYRLSELTKADMLFERGTGTEKEYLFKHNILQEVAYNSLLLKKRKSLHEETGKVIEKLYKERIEENYGLLGYHYYNSDNARKAIYYLDRSADRNYRLGENATSLSHYNLSLELCKKIKDYRNTAYISKQIGNIYVDKGEWNTAVNYYKNSLSFYLNIKDQRGVADVFNDIGSVYIQQGNWAECEKYYHDALTVAEKENYVELIAHLYNNLGILANIQGDWKKAVSYYKRSIREYTKVGDEHQRGMIYCNLGITYADKKEWEKAENYYERALELSETAGDIKLMNLVYLNRTELYLVLSNLSKAKECCDRAYEISNKLDDKLCVAECHKFYGIIYAQEKRWSPAKENFIQSIHLNQTYNNPLNLAETYYEYGVMFGEKGEKKQALNTLNQARKLFIELKAKNDVEKVDKYISEL